MGIDLHLKVEHWTLVRQYIAERSLSSSKSRRAEARLFWVSKMRRRRRLASRGVSAAVVAADAAAREGASVDVVATTQVTVDVEPYVSLRVAPRRLGQMAFGVSLTLSTYWTGND